MKKFCILGMMCVAFTTLSVGGCHNQNDHEDANELFNGKIGVEGHQLYVKCKGTGYPTILLEAGLGDSFSNGTWNQVYNPLAEMTTVCAYDRAGLGKSDLGPEPRGSHQIASELHALLQNLSVYKVEPPYILVGHSLGGFHIWTFANQYPDEVAGLVFVDTSIPLSWTMGSLPADCESIGAGLIEEGDGKEHATPGKVAEAAGAVYNFCNEAETLRSLPNIPVVALTSMRENKDTSQEFIQLYYAAHQRILELVDDGTHVTADAGHYIQKEMPDVLISSIQTLYDKITR